MADLLTFVINPAGETVPFGFLLKAYEDIDRLLRHVDYSIYGGKPQHRWVVRELKSSAPTIILQPDLDGRQSVEAVGVGLQSVTSGTEQPPPHFTEQVLEDLRKMKRLFGEKAKARSIGVLVDNDEAAIIQPDIAEKAGRILRAGHQNLGALEGTLDAIDVHRAPKVTVWDRVSKAPVRCSIPKGEEWTSRVKALLAKRVLVRGTISYFVNGVPRSVSNVVSIDDATPDLTLPRAGFGSISNKTVVEVGAAEWLNAIRGADPQ